MKREKLMYIDAHVHFDLYERIAENALGLFYQTLPLGYFMITNDLKKVHQDNRQ
jgi:hypothetical protein